ncbi:MAG: hypothetical protein AAFZ18_26960 [Myxococcota bacterium]
MRPHVRRIGLALSLLTMNGCSDCLGIEGASEALARGAVEAIETLPEILNEIDELLENNIDGLDAALARNIQETSKALRNQIDGINELLENNIDRIDALLAARIAQLERFARGLLQDVNGIVNGTINNLGYNTQALLQTLSITGADLIDTTAFRVIDVLEVGGRQVAVVMNRAMDLVLTVGAIVLLILLIIIGGIFFYRLQSQRRLQPQQWIPGTVFFGVMATICVVILFVPSARASLGETEQIDIDAGVCPDALSAAAGFLGSARGAETLPPEMASEAVARLQELYACQVVAKSSQESRRAASLIGDLERLIGLEVHCQRNEDCAAGNGERCEIGIGQCTTRCTVPQHCASGLVCHVDVGHCAAPCSSRSPCRIAGTRCVSGQCKATGAPPSKPGGKWPGGLLKPGYLTPRLKGLLSITSLGHKVQPKCIVAKGACETTSPPTPPASTAKGALHVFETTHRPGLRIQADNLEIKIRKKSP